MKKLVSLMLTLIMVAGCMAIPMTASAAAFPGENGFDFSNLATSSNVRETFDGSTSPGVTISDPTAGSGTIAFDAVDRGDDNGYALKWTGTAQAAGTSFWPIIQFDSLNLLTAADAVGAETWISFDFEISDTSMTRQICLYPWSPTSPFYVMVQNAGSATASYGGTATSDVVVGNGWHTLDVRQTKNAGSNSVKIAVFLDGKEVHADSDYWNSGGYISKMYIWQGQATTAGASSSLSLDNIRSFKCTKGDYTPVVPEKPVEPEKPEPTEGVKTVMGEYVSASDWGSGAGFTFTEVPGSNGKAASDKVIRMEIAPNGTNNTIHHLKYLPSTYTPSEDYDIIIEYDYRECDYNWNHFLNFFNWGSGSYFATSQNGVLTGQTWWPYYVPTMVAPINQWNHFTIRFTATPQAILYMNGVKIAALNTGSAGAPVNQWFWRHEYRGSAASGSYPGGAIEFDNFTVSAYTAGTFCEEYCTTRTPIFRNYDFEGINLTNGQYTTVMNGTTAVKAAEGFTYGAITGASIADGKAGKAASDKNLSYASTEENWKQFAVTNQSLFEGLGAVIEPGSTLRGGMSLLIDSTRPIHNSIRIATVVNSSAASNVMSQPAVFITTDNAVRVRPDTFTSADDLEAVEGVKLAFDKWCRLEYVINVSDGKEGSVNTVDFYLDGQLLNEEPIEIVYDVPSANAQPAKNPIGSFTIQIIDDYTNSFNVDDITLEYIPAGAEVDALAKTVALPGSADGSVVLGSGAIVLMDAATSAVTADALNAKLCPNTPVSLVNASGAAVTSGPAAGNYAYLSRGVLPGIFYKVSDLDVAIDGKEVTATLPYAADENVTMIVALYKDVDQFATCLSDTAEDGKLEVSVSDDEATSYKVFIWKGESWMMPFYAAAEGALN